ncbi:hypothetical protein [Rubritalea tangerina]|uniref:hypothetical protein n=1 Tax=Rubritalea tangerina TaxID=430798 RepID=UPI003619AF55
MKITSSSVTDISPSAQKPYPLCPLFYTLQPLSPTPMPRRILPASSQKSCKISPLRKLLSRFITT